MLYLKRTQGHVSQIFNDAGECIGQSFFPRTEDVVEYETDEGDPINVEDMPLAGKEYCVFNMIQPMIKVNPHQKP